MAIWKPLISNREGPLYLAIANALAEDISRGRLSDGERLPPQRDLADELAVALTTVTRAYSEAERRGLVSGEVGRGTFVRRREAVRLHRPAAEGAIDLTFNSLLPYPMGADLSSSMGSALASSPPWDLLDYGPQQGSVRVRRASQAWFERVGLEAPIERILVTAGAQHGMAVVFSAITNPGDLVLTGEVTYSGMKSLANFLRVSLRGLAMDEEGIRPDALEAACATTEAKALYCMPTLQNPTGCVMSTRRRQEIAAIAESYRIYVVEDDSYGFLLPEQRALSAYAQNGSNFVYITSTSKSLLPGLRVGFVLAPGGMVDRLAAAISATTFHAPAPTAELAARWIEDGTAERIMDWKRSEVKVRQGLAKKIFSAHDYQAHPMSPHGWLRLSEPYCVRDYVDHAKMRGVWICPAEDFVAGRAASPHAVRLCLGPVPSRKKLATALGTLAEILERPPAPLCSVV